MKQLSVGLYLDEDVNVLVADLIPARGFAAMTTQEADRIGSTDEEQLAFAASQGKTILTHNRADFEALAQRYYEQRRTHSGIIVAVRRHPKELARRLLILLNSYTADEIENQLRYI